MFEESISSLSAKVVEFLGLNQIGQLCQQFQVDFIRQCDTVAVRGMHRAVAAMESHLRRVISLHSHNEAYSHVFHNYSAVGCVPRMPPPGFTGMPMSDQWGNENNVGDRRQVLVPKHGETSQCSFSVEPASALIVKVEILEFLKLSVNAVQRIEELEKKYKVAVRQHFPSSSPNSKEISLAVSATSDDSQILQGLEELKQFCDRLKCLTFEIPKSAVSIAKQVKWELFNTVVTFENNLCVVVGNKKDVAATERIINEIGINWSTSSEKNDCENKFILQTGQIVVVKKGNIVNEAVDAIVNVANKDLVHGGGVAKAMSTAAGSDWFQRKSSEFVQQHGLVQIGDAVVTDLGNLKCKMVVHAVSPSWSKDEEKQMQCTNLLKELCVNSLSLTEERGMESIAVPGLGSGNFGIPDLICAKTLIGAVKQFFGDNHKSFIRRIVFMVLNDKTVGAFVSQARKQFGTTAQSESKQEDQQTALLFEFETEL